MRWLLAPVKTSSGPVTSRLCTLSNRTMRMVRVAMCWMVGCVAGGSKDVFPTFPVMGTGVRRPTLHEGLPYRHGDAFASIVDGRGPGLPRVMG